MQFLKEIREHLAHYETEAAAEIHKFIDWLHTKYVEPGAPVVAPPVTSYVEQAPTFTPASDNAPAAVPAADSAVAPAAPAPVEAPADEPATDPAAPVADQPVVEAQNGNA
jgi:hypothetical protein